MATVRTGIVLAKGEGALGVMTPIFRWLLGGAPVGNGGSLFAPASGQQWMSWIHIDDIVGIFLLALDNAQAQGPINGTAPNPVRNAEFSKALAKVLWRPFIPVGPPDALLEVVLGEVAQVDHHGPEGRAGPGAGPGLRVPLPRARRRPPRLFAPAPARAQARADPGGLRRIIIIRKHAPVPSS